MIKKILITFLVLILVAFLSVFGGMMFFESRFVYPGVWQRIALSETQLNQIQAEINFEIWEKPLDGEKVVEAIFIPAMKEAESRGTVIFAHGNNEIIDDWLIAFSPYYKDLNFNVLLVEYRGYGRSRGTPSQESLSEDFKYFYDKLIKVKGEQDRIVFHGRSIGGGVIIHLSQFRKSTHLIIESSFSSLVERAYELFRVPEFLIENKYRSEETLRSYDQPALIMHGKRDQLIPIHHGKKLFAALRGPKKFVEFDKGHNDIQVEQKLYWESVFQFLLESESKEN